MATVKIFRINYKSDFILTLNSDAGWMTPFCIKFWTGAPSQAYFVSFDGETYTHCAPVAGEPTKLQVQFDDHHLPIGDLKFQIGYHFTVADFPNDTEDEVLNQASVIVEQDGEPAKVMLDFNGETAPEIEFSLPAYANEAQRIANEEQRIEAEAQRIANEETRIANEATRQRNEATRIAQEEDRVSEFAQLKRESQQATTAANDAATLANQKAQLAQDKAALANDAATLANQKAQLAADKAALANDAAQLANEKAALANQKAQYAEQQGGYAKDQGDYAKEQGDYAKAQAGVIPVDVTRTQTDATFVNGNHEPLFHLRQATSSLAGLMTAAEHDKLNDMPSAQEANVGLIYDVSALHPTSGVNGGSTYASLSAALSVIPQGKQKGGMTVRYIQSSDNNYVQFRCMAQSFTTDITQWQGVDDEPTAGSNNLATSGGAEKYINLQSQINGNVVLENGGISVSQAQADNPYTDYINNSAIRLRTNPLRLPVQIKVNTNYNILFAVYLDENDNYLSHTTKDTRDVTCYTTDVANATKVVFVLSNVNSNLNISNTENIIKSVNSVITDTQRDTKSSELGIESLGTAVLPSDSPTRTTCFYIPKSAGTYPNFNNIQVAATEKCLFVYNESNWQKIKLYDEYTLRSYEVTSNRAVDYSNGELVSNNTFHLYKFKVNGGQKIAYNVSAVSKSEFESKIGIAFFDSDGVYISGKAIRAGIGLDSYASVSDLAVSPYNAVEMWISVRDNYIEYNNVAVFYCNDFNDTFNELRLIAGGIGKKDIKTLLGYYVNYSDGSSVTTSSSFACSNYINVRGIAKLIYSRIQRNPGNLFFGMAFYDENYQYISGEQIIYNEGADGYVESVVDVPSNAEFARFTLYDDENTYGRFFVREFKDYTKVKSVSNIKMLDGKSIDSTNGNEILASIYKATDYITLDEGVDVIRYKNPNYYTGSPERGMAFYDSSKNYISGKPVFTNNSETSYITTEINVPNNAKYVRFTILADATTYGDFALYFLSLNNDEKFESKESFHKRTTLSANVGSPSIYLSADTGNDNLNSLTTEDICDLYDALVIAHPNVLQRVSGGIGNASNNAEIPRYTLRLKDPLVRNSASNNEWRDRYYAYKTIVISSGIHGAEHTSVYGLYLAIKELLESSEQWAMYIKSNFILEILPVLNPYGFDIMDQNNVNNVNINRDFYDRTQVETVAIQNFIDSIKYRLHAVIDLHNTGLKRGYLVSIENCKYYTMYCQVAQKLAMVVLDSFENIIEDTSTYPYFCMWANEDKGQFHAWLAKQGIIGNSLEIPLNKNGDSPDSTAVNNSQLCKIVKELVINIVQTYGSIS